MVDFLYTGMRRAFYHLSRYFVIRVLVSTVAMLYGYITHDTLAIFIGWFLFVMVSMMPYSLHMYAVSNKEQLTRAYMAMIVQFVLSSFFVVSVVYFTFSSLLYLNLMIEPDGVRLWLPYFSLPESLYNWLLVHPVNGFAAFTVGSLFVSGVCIYTLYRFFETLVVGFDKTYTDNPYKLDLVAMQQLTQKYEASHI
ncbi:MAG: hypothetical protein U9Q15_03365 [Patescibacteria group bacterium]|nr:hypothetical protein [Patescibacteria group bacterium]